MAARKTYPDEYYEEKAIKCKQMITKNFPEVEVNSMQFATIFASIYYKITTQVRFTAEETAAKTGKKQTLNWD